MANVVETETVMTDEGRLPRFIIIGAGSRGNAYAQAVFESKKGLIVSVADPITSKRQSLGRKYIWKERSKQDDGEFDSWQDFLKYEQIRRKSEASGEDVLKGIDGVFVCTLDHTHKEIITALAPLKLHIMSEKPLATTWQDCLDIYHAINPIESQPQETIFSVGHVLRYSPHNLLLYNLLRTQKVIGDVLSMEHVEPVGFWHFAHSYVRGNWRKESIAAPSLMTKSCHDIDFLLWLLATPNGPDVVSSAGGRSFFKKSRKPKAAGKATNCLSCPHETSCTYSAKRIYLENHLKKGNADWPVKIVHPEIEDLYLADDKAGAEVKLLSALAEDYTSDTSTKDVESRPWYGRCVWESDNDVCDDQIVNIVWYDQNEGSYQHEAIKTASFHMVAFTESQCMRRGRIYGTEGEIEYNSKEIRVYAFADQSAKTYYPEQPGGGHGGGDAGLAGQFVKAVSDVKNKVRSASEAQALHVGCSLKDIIRSNALVFAAEKARVSGQIVSCKGLLGEQS